MSGAERLSMLGITGSTMPAGAGHALTKKEHLCGGFKDEFDWTALPLTYQKRIGALNKKPLRTVRTERPME